MKADEWAMERIDKARSHPIRRAVLLMLQGAGGGVSVSGAARALNEPVSNVAWHFRELEKARLIEFDRYVKPPGRGNAQVRLYKTGKPFTRELVDGVALDRIADLLDDCEGLVDLAAIAHAVQATGRPVDLGGGV